jgi:hypothetical protein
MSRYTASREKVEIEGMFPVLKKADCSKNRKNRQIRASASVSARKSPLSRAASRSLAAETAGTRGLVSSSVGDLTADEERCDEFARYMRFSNLTQARSVEAMAK